LQESLLKGGTAGLDYAKDRDTRMLNNDAAKRGIWSSGLVQQGQNDVNATYAPQYAAAGATAAGTAANLQNSQNQALNQYNLASSASQNAYNQNQASNTYNSQWAPLNYLKDIYNQSGGTISTGRSDSDNMNFM